MNGEDVRIRRKAIVKRICCQSNGNKIITETGQAKKSNNNGKARVTEKNRKERKGWERIQEHMRVQRRGRVV